MDNELKKYLESLTDKKLKTSDTRILGIEKRSANSDWHKNKTASVRSAMKRPEVKENQRKAQQEKSADPKYREHITEVNRKTAQTEEWKKASSEGLKKREDNGWREKNYEKNMKMVQTPEWKEAHKKAMQKYHATDIAKENAKQMSIKRKNNPEYRVKLLAALAKRNRPFHAGPYGVFPNKTAAAQYATEQGLSNALKKFGKWTKTDPTNYYFEEKNK